MKMIRLHKYSLTDISFRVAFISFELSMIKYLFTLLLNNMKDVSFSWSEITQLYD